MLVSFVFENYLSFKNLSKLNFHGASIKDHPENLHSPYFDNELRILKSLGLYGANSSGKSNVIKAFSFFRSFILSSSKESTIGQAINVNPFLLNDETEKQPSMFEAQFYLENIKYRYGFQVTQHDVIGEWLYQVSLRKEERIFLRSKKDFVFEKKFQNEFKSKLLTLTEFTNSNSLYLSVLAQFNVAIAQDIITWFKNIIVAHDTDHDALIDFSAGLLANTSYSKLMGEIMVNSGLGIHGIESRLNELAAKSKLSKPFLNFLLHEEQKNYVVRTKHIKTGKRNKPGDSIYFNLVENESLGTQKFFGLLGPILLSLKEKRLLLIDEIDARLHSLLLENVVALFNSLKYNPLGAQLIFTCHNTNLLRKKLRRDQMLLISKDESESSKIGSLHSLKPTIRNDASFDKDYLAGKYGAVPFLSTQMNLFES